MSIYQGSFAVTRYRILGGKKHYKYDELNQCLQPHQAKPLRLKGVQRPLIMGWVRPPAIMEEGIAADDPWDMADCRVEEGFALRLRLEKRQLPSAVVQTLYQKRLDQKTRSRKDRQTSSAERKELLQEVKDELLDQCLPAISYVDGFWHEDEQELWVFTTARSRLAAFEEFFYKTFAQPLGLSLMRVSLPSLAMQSPNWSEDVSKNKSFHQVQQTLPMVLTNHLHA